MIFLQLRKESIKMKRLTVEIDEQLHAEAKSQAYAEKKTLKEKIVDLIKTWLKK